MNIVVCGSEGYLGCVLWGELKRAGHRVRGYDRGLYGIRNLDDDTIDQADAVINLAALVGEPVCVANPDLTHDYNVSFAARQAQKADVRRVKTFVQISTCSVYGERRPDEMVDASTPVEEPEALPPYAASKVRVERELMSLGMSHTALKVIRLGTLCGPSPRMRFDLMANGFCLSAARGRRVTIYNPGSVRPHVSVSQVASMLRWVVEHPGSVPTLSTYVGAQHTVEELAHLAASACRARVEVDPTKAIDDRRSYRVACTDALAHIPDGAAPAMGATVRGLLAHRWVGADPRSPEWGNNGWRW